MQHKHRKRPIFFTWKWKTSSTLTSSPKPLSSSSLLNYSAYSQLLLRTNESTQSPVQCLPAAEMWLVRTRKTKLQKSQIPNCHQIKMKVNHKFNWNNNWEKFGKQRTDLKSKARKSRGFVIYNWYSIAFLLLICELMVVRIVCWWWYLMMRIGTRESPFCYFQTFLWNVGIVERSLNDGIVFVLPFNVT